MPNATPNPWRMFLPLGIVLLLAILWTGYWFIASGIAKDRLAAERLKLAAQGMTLECSQEGWGGYPFRFEFSCSSPAVSYGGKVELHSSNLMFVALAYAPWQVAALIDGPTHLSAPGVEQTDITHQRALAAVTFGKAWQPSFSAEVPAIAIGGFGNADKLMLFTRPAGSGGMDIALEVTKVAYMPPSKPAVRIDGGSLQGTLQADNAFKLDKFELRQEALRVWGSGMLTLDEQNRPSGQIDAETNDIQTLLAIAGPQFDLSDGKLGNLRTMLSLLGNDAKAPIIAKNGVLYIGPFQVTELKQLY